MFSGVGGVIFYQFFLMHIACCSTINASQFAGFLWLTAAVLMSIALGCGLIIDSGFKDEESSPKTWNELRPVGVRYPLGVYCLEDLPPGQGMFQ